MSSQTTVLENNSEINIQFTKPLIKWAGGKTQILKNIINHFPREFNNFHDVFLGGGSVLFALLNCKDEGLIKINGKVYAYDINKELIHVFKNIQQHSELLLSEIEKLKEVYLGIETHQQKRKKREVIIPNNEDEALATRESFYYWIRQIYNTMSSTDKISVFGSAIFIFLNKTCFRGLYRIGPNGFNVPYGNYKNPDIIKKEHLLEIKKLIKDVEFICQDFNDTMSNIGINDFTYLDPPYAPDIDINSFVKYTEDGFNIDNHKELFTKCNNLGTKRFLLNNHNTDFVKNYFTSNIYNIEILETKRVINSKNPESKTKEVIITNGGN